MYLTQIPNLTKDQCKRCVVWLVPEQKSYIEDLAHSSQCRERDVIHYIIAEYMESHPRIKVDMPEAIHKRNV